MFGYTLDDHVELRPLAIEHARAMFEITDRSRTACASGFRGWMPSPKSTIPSIISKAP